MTITPEGFFRVQITADMLATAQAKSAEMGTLKNSIRKGKGNLAGFLGEEIVLVAFPGSISNNSYNHDIDFDGVRLEVKTKDRTVSPSLDYDVSIANFNTRQDADFYVFVSLFRDKKTNQYTHGFVCGMIDKATYRSKSTFYRKGDIDPSNGWVVSADCHNLPISDLARL